MVYYAIKINGLYFKNYDYVTKAEQHRYAGNATYNGLLQEGDIKDIICTNNPERTETRRSIGGTLNTLYSIEKIKKLLIEIIPVEV